VNTLLFWVGGVEAISLVTLAITVIVQWRTASKIRPYDELTTAIREVAIQVSDISDFVERKETRERVRRMRDARAAKDAPVDVDAEPAPGSPEHKMWLRRKMLRAQSKP